MRSLLKSITFAATLAVGGLCSLSAHAGAPALFFSSPVDSTKPAKADGNVEIATIATDIEVIGWDKKEVSVQGEIMKGAKLDFDVRKKLTKITVKPPKNETHDSSALVVRVPKNSTVHVKTVAGRLRANGVSGPVALQSISGSVTIDGNPKEVEAVSVSGDLYIVSGSQRTFAKSVSGKVHVSGSRGKLTASSVSGRLEVVDAKLKRSQIATVSGAIELAGALLGGGPHDIKSHAGSIRLKLPKDSPVEIQAASFSGTIRNKFGNERKRGKLKISIGEGGPTVQIRSFSGAIFVEPE
jgi:DUF4097 and DUF4098 domain-containing protein YvlB